MNFILLYSKNKFFLSYPSIFWKNCMVPCLFTLFAAPQDTSFKGGILSLSKLCNFTCSRVWFSKSWRESEKKLIPEVKVHKKFLILIPMERLKIELDWDYSWIVLRWKYINFFFIFLIKKTHYAYIQTAYLRHF